jgi:hypothetical protein
MVGEKSLEQETEAVGETLDRFVMEHRKEMIWPMPKPGTIDRRRGKEPTADGTPLYRYGQWLLFFGKDSCRAEYSPNVLGSLIVHLEKKGNGYLVTNWGRSVRTISE